MACYRTECKEECDKLKEVSCVFKIDKKQYEYMKKIKNTYDVCICGNKLINARLMPSRVNIKICTKCKAIRRE